MLRVRGTRDPSTWVHRVMHAIIDFTERQSVSQSFSMERRPWWMSNTTYAIVTLVHVKDKLIHSNLLHSSYMVGVHDVLRIRQDDMQSGSADVDTSSSEVSDKAR